jgi:hypothetical protein
MAILGLHKYNLISSLYSLEKISIMETSEICGLYHFYEDYFFKCFFKFTIYILQFNFLNSNESLKNISKTIEKKVLINV